MAWAFNTKQYGKYIKDHGNKSFIILKYINITRRMRNNLRFQLKNVKFI